MTHLSRTIWNRIWVCLPELIPHPPPRIQDFGDLPYFHPCRLGRREKPSREQLDLTNPVFFPVRSSLPRESLGNRSGEVPMSNYRWLLNKKFTCVCMWFGVICFIVGVIALQIASFFKHEKSNILSAGVGCLSASFCLLAISMCTFLHAHLIIYDWDPDKHHPNSQSMNLWPSATEGEHRLSVTDEAEPGISKVERSVR
ncbi:hypothetical protein CRM22_008243 [Opisthorchis felineus]|uniref:Uncharacterized protein n=1 Tax=Opisthorchis felineus TaxID=147828 RepID=A0A4S2LCF4_OPIFE|nr:hypothetical protein CRM22_008243 [Opisthorchis felineus]